MEKNVFDSNLRRNEFLIAGKLNEVTKGLVFWSEENLASIKDGLGKIDCPRIRSIRKTEIIVKEEKDWERKLADIFPFMLAKDEW